MSVLWGRSSAAAASSPACRSTTASGASSPTPRSLAPPPPASWATALPASPRVTRDSGASDLEPQPDSKAIAECHRRLGILEKLRPICAAADIAIPGIVVVGEQSSGKSSLLENISGVQFPRDQNICTRAPCVLTLLSDPAVTTPVAHVGASPAPRDEDRCTLGAVEQRIRQLTEERTRRGPLISSEPIYVRVVRRSGPQLSIIDLPGLAHNANQMANIHEVTEGLVKEYVRKEEMVILCVVPALSDFGNAEAIKLAQRFDPAGHRTLGVITKCDFAAQVDSSDLVDKVLMRRSSDIKLPMGFHCVVNRGQKDVAERSRRDAVWRREQTILSAFSSLPPENCGTLRLMEKIAQIQARRLDQRLPQMREEVRVKLGELRRSLRELPVPIDTEQGCSNQLNGILRDITSDLQSRVRGEFVGTQPEDQAMAIAPRVADIEEQSWDRLKQSCPKWLGQEKISEVTNVVKEYAHGYSVDNLPSPHVFVGFIRRTFVEGGLLRDAVEDLVYSVRCHLQAVASHVVHGRAGVHAPLACILNNHAAAVVEEGAQTALRLCRDLVEAQQVQTTHRPYLAKLAKFRQCWTENGAKQGSWVPSMSSPNPPADGDPDCQPTREFMHLFRDSQKDPMKGRVLETCASLHIYSGFLIDGFADMALKLVRFNMVENLPSRLDDRWRDSLGHQDLRELFPVDQATVARRAELQGKIADLQDIGKELAALLEPLASTQSSDGPAPDSAGPPMKRARVESPQL